MANQQMVNLKEKTALFYDNGLFIELAIHLSKKFGKVYYYTPWKNAFPKSTSVLPGFGLKEIERINEFWDYADEVDIFIFPDVYDGDLQEHLIGLGKRVWGARKGEELELLRAETKQHLKKIGCDVQPYKVITGLDNLRDYLKDNRNKYVKISTYRGDFETFRHDDYKMSEPKLDELEHHLGARKYITEFIVEDAVDNAVEVGYDGFTIDGQYPKQCVAGYEIKDVGYAGVYKEYNKLPKQITDFNAKIAPTLKSYGYRGFMSTEIRVEKGTNKCYMIDFCARAGSPPNELYQEMYANLAEIIWFGSEGIMVEPIPTAKYGIEVMIHSSWADKNWQSIEFPQEIRQWIKLRNLAYIKDCYYVVPQAQGLPEIGAIVAVGDTLEEAIEKIKSYIPKIKGYYIDIKEGSIDTVQDVIAQGEKQGLNLF